MVSGRAAVRRASKSVFSIDVVPESPGRLEVGAQGAVGGKVGASRAALLAGVSLLALQAIALPLFSNAALAQSFGGNGGSAGFGSGGAGGGFNQNGGDGIEGPLSRGGGGGGGGPGPGSPGTTGGAGYGAGGDGGDGGASYWAIGVGLNTSGSFSGQDGTDGHDGGTGGAGGGGGAGGYGVYGWNAITVTLTGNGTVSGGDGGNGGGGNVGGNPYQGGLDGGNGGDGGSAVYFTDSATLNSSMNLLGGNGGNGGDVNGYSTGGSGGKGGNGILAPDGLTLTSSGSITGGNGGTGGITRSHSFDGSNGAGGAGVYGANMTITTSGSISGGLSGDGVTRADAITFTGGANTLTLQNGWSLTGNLGVNGAGTTLAFKLDGIDADVSNTITGAGGIVVDVAGHELTLSGSNTYAGGTLIKAGTLSVSSDANLGDASGGLTLDGGKLKWGAAYDSARDVIVSAGGGTFDTNGFGSTLSGIISGSGDLFKTGLGKLTLTGDSSGFVGSTSVEGGTLAINGVLGGTVDVLSTGRLQGSGTAGDITVSGTLAPGNSIGTLNAASATFNAGMTYDVEVNSAGASDLLNVAGITTINGGKVVVLPYPDFAVNTRYTIVTSAGGVSGTFDAVDFALASMFLTASLSYDANDVYLTINQKSFASLALTANQTAAATAAESLGAGNTVYDAIYGLTSADAVRRAYDALSGEVHASVAGVLMNDSRYVRDAVFARLLQASYAGGGATQIALAANGPATAGRMALGATDKTPPSGPAATGLAFWTQGYGAWGSFDGNGNAASLDRTLGGFVSGVDAGLGGGWRAGIATGYARSNLSVDARLSSGDIDSYHLIGYFGGTLGDVALRGGGAWTWNNVETQRTVAFPGFYDRDKASYDGNTGQVFGEVALPLSYGASAWEPFARLAYVHVDTGGFTESGGAAVLTSSGVDQSLGLSTLGVRLATTMHIAGAEVVPHASLAWQHAFGDVDPAATLAFASGGAAFTVLGAPISRDSALLDAGLAVTVAPDATLALAYSGQLAGDANDNAVTGRFDWRF